MRYELKALRTLFGYTQEDMASKLGITKQSYSLKERGMRSFDDGEKLMLVGLFGLSLKQFNTIFYRGALPYGGDAD